MDPGRTLEPVDFYDDARLIPSTDGFPRMNSGQLDPIGEDAGQCSDNTNDVDAVNTTPTSQSLELGPDNIDRRTTIVNLCSSLTVLLILFVTIGISVGTVGRLPGDENALTTGRSDTGHAQSDNSWDPDAARSFPPAPENLHDICWYPQDEDDYSLCVSTCVLAECCFLPFSKNCRRDDDLSDWCDGYVSCSPFYFEGKDDKEDTMDPVLPSVPGHPRAPEGLEEMCTNISEDDEFLACMGACSVAECCFLPLDDMSTNACHTFDDEDLLCEWCGEYERFCVPLFYNASEQSVDLSIFPWLSVETPDVEIEHSTFPSNDMTPHAETLIRPSPPSPPEDLVDICTIDSVSAVVVSTDCWFACAPTECCFVPVTSESNSMGNLDHRCHKFFDFNRESPQKWCDQYRDACWSLFNEEATINSNTDSSPIGKSGSSPVAIAVDKACDETKLRLSAESFEICKALCDARACCLSNVQNCRSEKDPQWCDDVEACEVLFERSIYGT